MPVMVKVDYALSVSDAVHIVAFLKSFKHCFATIVHLEMHVLGDS